MVSVTRCVSLSAFSPLHVACRLLHFPRCMLHVVDGLLSIFQWSSAALLTVGSCLRALSLLHVARFTLHGVCFLLPAPVPHVAWCALSVACPILHRPSVPCCMPCVLSVAFPASRLVTLRVLRCESSVARCTSPVACCRMFSLGCWLSRLACRLPHAVGCNVAE